MELVKGIKERLQQKCPRNVIKKILEITYYFTELKLQLDGSMKSIQCTTSLKTFDNNWGIKMKKGRKGEALVKKKDRTKPTFRWLDEKCRYCIIDHKSPYYNGY